jgi:hypothetical protein
MGEANEGQVNTSIMFSIVCFIGPAEKNNMPLGRRDASGFDSRKQGFDVTQIAAAQAGDGSPHRPQCGCAHDGRSQAAAAANVQAGRISGEGSRAAIPGMIRA